jgi:WD40 repeat protein
MSAPKPASTKQFQEPSEPNVSTSPTDDTQYFVKFHDGKPALQVKLERVWTHRSLSINSVKFSPDGKHLAVGVADGRGFDSQRTYIYDVTIGKKIWSVEISYILHHDDLFFVPVGSQIDTQSDNFLLHSTYLSLLETEDISPQDTRLVK